MLKHHPIIKGAMILTIASIITRALGFLYRIFLSNLIGAEGMGIFQLIFPVLTFCIALSCGGIQIAVSRFVAESRSRAHSFAVLISSLVMSLLISCATCAVVYCFSDSLAIHIIKNADCGPLLKYASITIPVTAIHSCIAGYYLGLKKTFVPAWSTVTEQIVKIAAIYILGILWIRQGIPITPMIAVYSMIFSEVAGALFCVIAVGAEKKYRIHPSELMKTAGNLFSISYILTLNRILLTFLQCVEAILLPIVLVKSGLSNSQSLVIYGVLTGMALPVITFPSAITNSISTMILPSIAESNVENNHSALKKTIENSIWFSTVSGIFGIGIFLTFGNFIGSEIFGHAEAGIYIEILAWLCPFLYLSITLGSVLHGLGKTTAAFVHNLISIIIRLAAIWWTVPIFGINGYLWGLLVSHLATTLLHYVYMKRTVSYRFSAWENIIKPVFWLTISLAAGFLIKYIFCFAAEQGQGFSYITNGIQLLAVCVVFFACVAKNHQK